MNAEEVPAASLAFAARNKGAVVVEINAEPTPLTEKADYVFEGKSGEILPRLVEAVWGKNKSGIPKPCDKRLESKRSSKMEN